MTGPNSPEQCVHLSEIIGNYQALFVDIWGVLHDGHTAYPGAADALLKARAQGCKVVLISNSASAVPYLARHLEQLGITGAAYDGLMSAGQLSMDSLMADDARSPVLIIRENSGPAWLNLLPHHVVAAPADASVVVVTGIPCRTEQEAHKSGLVALLDDACARGLPMICADPDETFPENGAIRLGPGWLSRYYREAGGRVTEFGKPHPAIYAAARSIAGDPPIEKVLAIGDNLLTDIAGAAREGLDSLMLLSGGVHEAEGENAVEAHARRGGAVPTYLAQGLVW